MFAKIIFCAAAFEALHVSAINNVDADIQALRGSGKLPIVTVGGPTLMGGLPSASLIQNGVETFKKPLSVAEFSEWLHNLYFNEEKKRKATIDAMLENDSLNSV